MERDKTVHVIVEVIAFAGILIYTREENRKLKKKLESVQSELDELKKFCIENFKMVGNFMNGMNPPPRQRKNLHQTQIKQNDDNTDDEDIQTLLDEEDGDTEPSSRIQPSKNLPNDDKKNESKNNVKKSEVEEKKIIPNKGEGVSPSPGKTNPESKSTTSEGKLVDESRPPSKKKKKKTESSE